MDESGPTPRWVSGVSRTALFLAVLTAVLAALMSLQVRPGAQSLAAPLLGPWAGVLWGHHDCTMAQAIPVVSWAAVAFGVFAWGVFCAGTHAAHRMLGAVLVLLWALFWCGLAVLSLINSTS